VTVAAREDEAIAARPVWLRVESEEEGVTVINTPVGGSSGTFCSPITPPSDGAPTADEVTVTGTAEPAGAAAAGSAGVAGFELRCSSDVSSGRPVNDMNRDTALAVPLDAVAGAALPAAAAAAAAAAADNVAAGAVPAVEGSTLDAAAFASTAGGTGAAAAAGAGAGADLTAAAASTKASSSMAIRSAMS